MSAKARRFFAGLLAAVCAVSCCVALLAALLNGCGSSAGLMLSLMRSEAPPETTALPESEYPGMAVMITGYLSGAVDVFQYTYTSEDGSEIACFNEKEQAHMADCKALFVLDRRVLLLCVALALLCGAGSALLRPGRRAAALGAACGFGAVLAALLAVFILAATDFDAVFVAFHHLAFTNALWLMNPRTDMIIRLMPETFFMKYALMVGLTWLTAMAAGLIISLIRLRGRKRKAHDP